ncbi:MAG: hypothetical protein QOI35_4048 [Cryptosporangiaceae bacterium]|jgi:hypothetical protein|nr:hypothetical protein [Cryptosporangiaceae bacterium]
MPETDQPAENRADDHSGDQAPGDVSGAVGRLTDADLGAGERARLLGTVAASAGGGQRSGIRRFVMGPRAAAHWAQETLLDIAPRLPIRDLDTLRRHHGGKSGDELADALIKSASRAAAAIGAAGGGVASVEWAAPPTLLTAPVLIAAETVGVVAVELKLIAELHEVYGSPVRGSATEKGAALLGAWAHRRGVSLSLLNPGGGLTTILGAGMRKELQKRLIKRMGRNLTSIGPLLTGAAVAAELNRRATRGLGEAIRDDLRKAPRQLR